MNGLGSVFRGTFLKWFWKLYQTLQRIDKERKAYGTSPSTLLYQMSCGMQLEYSGGGLNEEKFVRQRRHIYFRQFTRHTAPFAQIRSEAAVGKSRKIDWEPCISDLLHSTLRKKIERGEISPQTLAALF